MFGYKKKNGHAVLLGYHEEDAQKECNRLGVKLEKVSIPFQYPKMLETVKQLRKNLIKQ